MATPYEYVTGKQILEDHGCNQGPSNQFTIWAISIMSSLGSLIIPSLILMDEFGGRGQLGQDTKKEMCGGEVELKIKNAGA